MKLIRPAIVETLRKVRITDEEVRAIRKAYRDAKGQKPILTELAKKYNSSPNYIHNLVKGRYRADAGRGY